jgi:hypothetical protein
MGNNFGRTVAAMASFGVSELVRSRVEMEDMQREMHQARLEHEAALSKLQMVQTYKEKYDKLLSDIDAASSPDAAEKLSKRLTDTACETVNVMQLRVPPPIKNVAVFGITSAGKSTLLNAIFGLKCEVGDGEVTLIAAPVGVNTDKKFVVSDVYGSNDERLYEALDSLKAIALVTHAIICTHTTFKSNLKIAKILKALPGGKVYFVHTHADSQSVIDKVKASEEAFCNQHGIIGPFYTTKSVPDSFSELRRRLMLDLEVNEADMANVKDLDPSLAHLLPGAHQQN